MAKSVRAFTLIELLIVIGIIALLALIALPNFLEAQTRSRVSRSLADMRTVATALEAYSMDCGTYPDLAISYDPNSPKSLLTHRLKPITTPVAYVTTLPYDSFNPGDDPMSRNRNNVLTYGEIASMGAEHLTRYAANTPNPNNVRWVVLSYGPCRNPGDYPEWSHPYWEEVYDPTNGTMSVGCVKRVGP